MATTLMKFSRTVSYITKRGININEQCRSLMTKLIYKEYGDPVKVVSKEQSGLDEKLQEHEVIIKMLASPVNPADINTIQGTYPVKPRLPSVPGNEGVGEIIETGSQVKKLKKGDRVVLATNALGTWRTHLKVPSELVIKIPKELGLVEAATLTVNPCTAYRLLRDFVALKPGDTVIQNGANSAAGQNIIQVAKVWGYKTINVIRDRPNIKELKDYLTQLGATVVLTEEELWKTKIFRTGEMKKPKLALNCIGGKSSLELLRQLDHGGTMVTYGGMSREPVTCPTGPLIFKDIKIRGFWMTRWSNMHATSPERKEMIDEIITMILDGILQKPKVVMVPFSDYKTVLEKTTARSGKNGQKYVFDFSANEKKPTYAEDDEDVNL